MCGLDSGLVVALRGVAEEVRPQSTHAGIQQLGRGQVLEPVPAKGDLRGGSSAGAGQDTRVRAFDPDGGTLGEGNSQ